MGQHQAERRSSRSRHAATPRVAGRRVAAKPPRPSPLLRRPLSAVPSIAGVLALVVAGGGAVTTGGSAAPGQAPSASNVAAASLPVGVSNDSRVVDVDLEDREAAISRDSSRQALQDAADADLVDAAEEQAVERNADLKSLARATEQRAGEIALDQWSLPTSNYRLTARFGMSGSYWSSSHTGLDFAAPSGTPIVSVATGTVTETGYDGAYGNRTIVTLTDGTEIWYCHQTSIGVEPGQSVTSGQQIGTVGSTGNSTGPHLHFEVRPGGGDPVDPEQALAFHGLNP